MLKKNLLAAALVAFSQSVLAQQQPPVGGGQLQQIPPAPVPERPAPAIRIEQGSAPANAAADQQRILVNRLQIADARVYSEADLLALTGFKPGSELTLGELRAMATKISDYYHAHGYFLTQVFLPAQEIKDGVVTLNVLEGQYGNITLRNHAKLDDSLPQGLLNGLNTGDTVQIEPLENRLLLLSDIPGVEVKSTLTPGASVGTSDLVVDVAPGRSVTGEVDADNAGNRYTGRYRVGGTVNLNNPTGHGDVLSFRGLTSGEGLKYGRAAYQTQLGRATVGVAYAALEYHLGKEFSALGAHGTAEIASVFASYPLIRSRNTNLYALADFDAKTFQDKVDSTNSVTDKKAQVLMLGLHGNHRDSMGGAGGLTTGALTLSTGKIDIRTPSALAVDQATARSNGSFEKIGYSAARLQNVTDRISLYAGINGQFAGKNLDISEKIGLGGMYGVRAYPQGEGYGDEGYIVNLEARYLLLSKTAPLPGQVHLVGFIDTGTVTINKSPWVAGENRRTLSAIGFGVTWADYNNFAIRAYYAHKLGSAPTLSEPDASGRCWIQAIKSF